MIKAFVIPFTIATSVVAFMMYYAPQLGPFAYISAWMGIFFCLSVWGLVTSS